MAAARAQDFEPEVGGVLCFSQGAQRAGCTGYTQAELVDLVSRDSAHLEWPFEGLWFDVQKDGLCWPERGEKPTGDQVSRPGNIVAKASKLIPLHGHRYPPGTPNEQGDPLFSVYQSDVIC